MRRREMLVGAGAAAACALLKVEPAMADASSGSLDVVRKRYEADYLRGWNRSVRFRLITTAATVRRGPPGDPTVTELSYYYASPPPLFASSQYHMTGMMARIHPMAALWSELSKLTPAVTGVPLTEASYAAACQYLRAIGVEPTALVTSIGECDYGGGVVCDAYDTRFVEFMHSHGTCAMLARNRHAPRLSSIIPLHDGNWYVLGARAGINRIGRMHEAAYYWQGPDGWGFIGRCGEPGVAPPFELLGDHVPGRLGVRIRSSLVLRPELIFAAHA